VEGSKESLGERNGGITSRITSLGGLVIGIELSFGKILARPRGLRSKIFKVVFYYH